MDSNHSIHKLYDQIIIISSEFPPGPGGIGTHAYQLAKYFSDHGIKVVVCAPQDYALEKEIIEFNQNCNFKVVSNNLKHQGPIRNYFRIASFIRTIKNHPSSFIIASGLKPVWLAFLVSRFLRFPWLAVGHGTEFTTDHLVRNVISKVAYNAANGLVAVSAYTKKQMQSIGIDTNNCQVIHNGADDKIYFPLNQKTCRQQLGVLNEPVLLSVGNVSERKGHDIVIRSLPTVLKVFPDLVYLIAGLPTLKKPLEKLARELRVQDHVRFLGRVNSDLLPILYNSCDLFVLTSRTSAEGDSEGFGIVVIEAALCGKPAVVSAGSGLEEAVVDGVTGSVVPSEDPVLVAEAIIDFLKDQEKYTQYGQAAHNRAKESLTWQKVAIRYQEIVRNVWDSFQ